MSSKPTILETIYTQRAKDVALAKETPGTTPDDLATLLAIHLAPPLVPLVPRLKANPSSLSSPNVPSPSLMAEIKRASPSKGPIAMTTNAAQQALTYALAGASVISVLTEPSWFKGSLLDMRLARQAIDALPDRPAILRKDFILDEYQIMEARLHGADTVLLIVAMLPVDRLQALYSYSLSLGMEPLVEVNNATEMKSALALGAKVIGVNNRNLHTFDVDMGTTSRLVEMVRERDVVLCALSGISSAADVRGYKAEGVRAVLVGEALMRAQDTSAFIRELLDWPAPSPTQSTNTPHTPLVKVSNITTAEAMADAIGAGADILTLTFDPTSPHNVSLPKASIITAALSAARVTSSPTASLATMQAPWFALHLRSVLARRLPLLIAAFANTPLSEILSTLAALPNPPDLVQLPSTTPAAWVRLIPVPVIYAFAVDRNGVGAEGVARPGVHAFALVDVGEENDVDALAVARKIVEAGEVLQLKSGTASAWQMPIILAAGGLEAAKVKEAAWNTGGLWAVDVSFDAAGGAEGVKSFVQQIKGN